MTGQINFDGVAPFYDRLASLIYGREIWRSQLSLVDHIPENAKVLYVGGGTGQLLPVLLKSFTNARFDYVEPSTSMLRRAKRRVNHSCRINFIQSGIEEASLTQQYDVIITAYFLDMFSAQELHHVVCHLDGLLNSTGIWLLADFQPPKRRIHRYLLKTMYAFFRRCCGLQNQKLESFGPYFLGLGYQPRFEREFFNGFIQSKVWQK